MTEEEPIEEPNEAEDNTELTPEERERLEVTRKRLRRALARITRDMAMLPKLAFHESDFKNISVVSTFASQQSKLLDAIKPAWAVQEAWKKQFPVIDSDIFKHTALTQTTLGAITARLTKNVDFGLSDTFTKLAQQVVTQQSAWLKTVGPAFESLKRAFYPPNLRQIDGLRWEEVQSVVMVDGIALYGVPRSSIAAEFVKVDEAIGSQAAGW